MSNQTKDAYARDGFVSPVRIIDESQVAAHRSVIEDAEQRIGPLHYKYKVHTILRSPLALATEPAMLDVVEALIGPDILLYNVCYIIKEPRTDAHVSWHQDLSYWGLSCDAQVSAWLALTPATASNGCMRMIPGSHRRGPCSHRATDDPANLLYHGQTVDAVDEESAISCALRPGEASFHHGWTLHSSTPNTSAERRIGVNIQYLATEVRQTQHDLDTALLVRGTDRHRHFAADLPATGDLEPGALARQATLQARLHDIYTRAAH